MWVNERHALDKTAFSCISFFAGAFTLECIHSKVCQTVYRTPNECAFIHFFFLVVHSGMHAVVKQALSPASSLPLTVCDKNIITLTFHELADSDLKSKGFNWYLIYHTYRLRWPSDSSSSTLTSLGLLRRSDRPYVLIITSVHRLRQKKGWGTEVNFLISMLLSDSWYVGIGYNLYYYYVGREIRK